jgi:hypothetical protein
MTFIAFFEIPISEWAYFKTLKIDEENSSFSHFLSFDLMKQHFHSFLLFIWFL